MSRIPVVSNRSRSMAGFFRVLLLALPGLVLATNLASAQGKPPLIVDDYGQWKRITSTALSPDGAWMSYAYDRLEGEDTLYVKALDGPVEHVIVRGTAPAFSRDSRWVAYQIAPPEREGGGAAARQGGPQAPAPGQRPGQGGGGGEGQTMVLRDLATGDSITFADVASFSFPENTDVVLIRKRGAGDDADHEGADLVIHDLNKGTSLNLGNVSEFSVNDPGTHLAYLVDAAGDAGNGLYLMELASNRIHALDTHQATYSELTWNEEGMPWRPSGGRSRRRRCSGRTRCSCSGVWRSPSAPSPWIRPPLPAFPTVSS